MTEMELFPLFEGLELPFCQETWASCGGPLSTETMEKYGLEVWDNGYDLGNDPDGTLGLYRCRDGYRWQTDNMVTNISLGDSSENIVMLFEYDEEYYFQRTGRTLEERLEL